MSRMIDEPNQRSHTDLFRTLVTDSKLVYLCHAIEQHEQAQVHLRHNEEQQRQLRQYMEYNHLRVLELDLARQRLLNANPKADSHGIGTGDSSLPASSSAQLIKPPEMFGAKAQQSLLKQRSTAKNSLPLQRSSNPSGNNSKSNAALQPQAATEILLSLQREPSLVDMHSSVSHVSHAGRGEEIIQKDNTQIDDAMDGDLHSARVARPWIEKDYTDQDVLCERGNFSYNHPGNKAYRTFVKSLQDQYVSSKKNDKVAITTKVLLYITKTCGGRFLGHDEEGGGGWKELSEDEIRRKIGQSLREKNKRYVPSPRKRFASDVVVSSKGTDVAGMKGVEVKVEHVHHPV